MISHERSIRVRNLREDSVTLKGVDFGSNATIGGLLPSDWLGFGSVMRIPASQVPRPIAVSPQRNQSSGGDS